MADLVRFTKVYVSWTSEPPRDVGDSGSVLLPHGRQPVLIEEYPDIPRVVEVNYGQNTVVVVRGTVDEVARRLGLGVIE